jgi:hypothetical protein
MRLDGGRSQHDQGVEPGEEDQPTTAVAEARGFFFGIFWVLKTKNGPVILQHYSFPFRVFFFFFDHGLQ